MKQKNFVNDIKTTVNEKDVENTYRKYISHYYGESITSPYNSDGVLKTMIKYDNISKQLILLMEFKEDINIKHRVEMMKVLIQVLYYMKKFEEDGEQLPNVILVADKNEAFVLHSNNIINFLNEKIDWSIAPSTAPTKNPELLKKLFDAPFYPFVFDINEEFKLQDLFDKISDITAENNRQIRITENNISKIYEYFIVNVVKDYEKINSNTLVLTFIQMMLLPDLIFRENRSTLVLDNNEEIKVEKNNYKAFIKHFNRKYTPEEEMKFTEISDRLIEETDRRKLGAYYTPTAFVDYSHKMIEKNLGKYWNYDFTVWDCAWGTGNLTRDINFKKLFASTYNQSEIDMGQLYNSNAVKFQYDFLNDDVNDVYRLTNLKMPKKLNDAISNYDEKILFYINPPYGTGGNANSFSSMSKKDLAKTEIAEEMRRLKLSVSEQMYAQFLFRILQFKIQNNSENMYIALFSPTLFMTGSKYKKFRELFNTHFEFVDGAMFRASHFADVKNNWAIAFTIWKSKKSTKQIDYSHFNLKILDRDEAGIVIEKGTKILWNLDNDKTLQNWFKEKSNNVNLTNKEFYPNFTSAFKFKEDLVEVPVTALGYLANDTNNVEATTKGVYFLQTPVSRNVKKTVVDHSNFEAAVVTFTARKLISTNWINQKNEFSAPEEDSELYKLFCVNSVVYTIFSPSNYIISFRNIELGEEKYSRRNEWFFMKNSDVRELANINSNREIYMDTKGYGNDSFVFKYLSEHKDLLTPTAKELIVDAVKLIKDTFSYREMLNIEHPEYHINTWDSSWYQIKQLSELAHKDDFDKHHEKWKVLTNELLEMSENLGFIKYSE